MKLKNKILTIISTIITLFAIVGFVFCMIYAVTYFIELGKSAEPCPDTNGVCVSLEAEPIIFIVYLIFGIITAAISVIGAIFSGICMKSSKLTLAAFIVNLAITFIVVAIFVTMLITIKTN